MRKPDVTLFIHDAAQGHAPHFKQVDLLPVHARNGVVGIGQTDKGNILISPVLLECRGRVRTDRQYLHAAAGKFFMVITQAR